VKVVGLEETRLVDPVHGLVKQYSVNFAPLLEGEEIK
jgi:hypothetical protein